MVDLAHELSGAAATALLAPAPESQSLEGGYIDVTGGELLAVWAAHRDGRMRKRALATWAALREIEASRQAIRRSGRGRMPGFTAWEVCRIRGETPASAEDAVLGRVRADIRELEAAGVLDWSETQTRFRLDKERWEPEQLAAWRRSCSASRRGTKRTPVPRRALRLMARGLPACQWAALVAILMRCCWWRGPDLALSGTVMAAWVERVFGISPRRWREATQALEAGGSIRKEMFRSRTMRYREGLIVHLAPPLGAPSPSPSPAPASEQDAQGEPHQNPPGLVGTQNSSLEEKSSKNPQRPSGLVTGVQNPSPDKPKLGPESSALERQLAMSLEVDRAYKRGFGPTGSAERRCAELRAMAAHALKHGRDPIRLFWSNVRNERWSYITCEDEARAQASDAREQDDHGTRLSQAIAQRIDEEMRGLSAEETACVRAMYAKARQQGRGSSVEDALRLVRECIVAVWR